MSKKKKKIERICKNCKLFNPKKLECSVVILYGGERFHLPVDPQDSCFFEKEVFDPITGKKEDLNEIKEVKWWVEDPVTGKQSDKGNVKIQYPEGFFGKER
jgi:hypothetical protein